MISDLKEMLYYNPETGLFTWLVSKKGHIKAGDIAGYIHSSGYRIICINGKRYRAHRLAWLYMTGAWPECQIDHDNQIRSDNRFLNLKEATNEQNAKNCKRRVDNTSGVTGVWFHKQVGKWCSEIFVKGKKISLGVYENINDAIAVRETANILYGFHKNHGADHAQ